MINKIIEDLIKEINKVRFSDIILLSLLGSYRENEAVAKHSDCDFLFILKANKYGNISYKTIKVLKDISEIMSKKYPITFSFLTHTEFDLREYVDIEYLEHYSWGKVLIGTEAKYKKLFSRILHIKDTTDKTRKALMYHNIIHARFNVLRKYISLNKYNSKNIDKQLAVLLVDNIIEIIDWILIYDGNYFKTKQEIIKQFSIKNKNINASFLNEVMQVRKKFSGNIKLSKLKSFNRRAVHLLNQLTELTIKKHKRYA